MRSFRITAVAAVAAVAVGGLAACGDDAGTEPDTGTTADAPEDAGGDTDTLEDETPGDEAAGGETVTVRDIAFQTGSLTVAAGTPVTWVNEDSVGHTVTAGTPDDPTGEFDEDLPAGEEVEIAVDEPGTYPYFCRIHPTMTAELVVE